MKLYTEIQLLEAIDKASLPNMTILNILDSLTPIELPSDEEIWNQADEELSNLTKDSAFMRGAKWMRDKIQGGNK